MRKSEVKRPAKRKKNTKNFALFIITHKRHENQLTLRTLERAGYTGKVFLVCDTGDPTLAEYKKLYGDKVVTFEKKDYIGKFDIMINEQIMGIATYARAALYDIAKKKKLDYMVVMDDDYTGFYTKIDATFNYIDTRVMDMDKLIAAHLKYLHNANLDALAFAQAGDFIGGENGGFNRRNLPILRKIMNVFFFDVDKPVYYHGAMNDDVIAGITLARQGRVALSPTLVSTIPAPTQSISGGLTEMYRDNGTYTKSMYSVVASPSSVIAKYQDAVSRVHHMVNADKTYPLIIEEKYKKR